ncbi:MAG: hypothetical protein QOJ19_3727 [Acidimicrobiia bacterium]|jgi:hypothetical protein|nr:hypothetical protein [Acidimicrobiia bacterium]
MKGATHETTFSNVTMSAVDDEVESVDVLKQRAEALRRTASSMHELVARAYRRRAAELELQAWLTQVKAGDVVGPLAA